MFASTKSMTFLFIAQWFHTQAQHMLTLKAEKGLYA